MIYSLAVLVAILVFAVFGPPLFEGHSARHNWLGVKIYSVGVTRSGNDRNAVLVQERGEWRLSKLLGIAFAGTLTLATHFAFGPITPPDFPVDLYPFLTLFAQVIFDQYSREWGFVDYAGHGAEIMEAEQLGIQDYRESEIERMIQHDKREHMTPAEVSEKLDEWEWLAKVVHYLGRKNA